MVLKEKAGGGRGRAPAGKAPTRTGGGRATLAGSLVVLLAGCTTTGSYAPTDKYFTVEHGTVMFGAAMNRARAHCEKLGMDVRHLGTQETGFLMVSRFECVPK